MIPGRIAGSGVLLIALAGAASAQAHPSYQLLPGDTLRYSETVRWKTFLSLPQGDLPSTFARDALVSLSANDDGSWRAWYDDLDVRSIRQAGLVAPDAEFLMGRPFVLEVSPTGGTRLVEPPTIRAEFADFYDATLQFVDFFASLPESSLTPGTTWSDSVSAGASSQESEYEVARRFTVVADTLFAGAPATVISVTASVSISSRQRGTGADRPGVGHLTGSGEGVVIFDVARGVMLYRAMEGWMDGTLTVTGREYPQRVTYSSSISILP